MALGTVDGPVAIRQIAPVGAGRHHGQFLQGETMGVERGDEGTDRFLDFGLLHVVPARQHGALLGPCSGGFRRVFSGGEGGPAIHCTGEISKLPTGG